MEKFIDAASQAALKRAQIASALRAGNWNESITMPDITEGAYDYQAPSSKGSGMDSSATGKAAGTALGNWMNRDGVSSPGRQSITPSNRTGTLGQGLNVTANDSTSWLSKLFGG